MIKFTYILSFLFLCLLIPFSSSAQTNDFGAIGSVSISKDFGRFSGAKLEQELRFDQNVSSFNRSLTSLGINYSLLRKLLMAEMDYDFIYQHKKDRYEFRHRATLGLSSELKLRTLEIGLRTRGQSTWRDELRGSYNYNPKYVWRNKLECAYDIFGSPLKPFISGELFCPINGAKGFYLDSYRATLGLKYRISRHTSVQVQLRYDQEIQQANPKSIMYAGVGWNYKL
ncbi:MAG: DUF2490 domain-containing protein [Paludibacter sp.]|nr:DUF2490 domain-containing protein [Paludibacter sp.]